MSKNHPEYCHSATTVGIRLANQSAVLVTSSGAKGTLRSGGVTLWHVTWAAASAVALGTAEVTGQSLHFHSLLIRFAARAWVAVVSGVGCIGHLQLRQMNECRLPYSYCNEYINCTPVSVCKYVCMCTINVDKWEAHMYWVCTNYIHINVYNSRYILYTHTQNVRCVPLHCFQS